MLTPLKATTIYRVNKETKQVLLCSRIRLAMASPYEIGILYVLAIAKGRGYLIVRKDSSKGNIEVKEMFVNKLVEAN
jgi:hypothetical protein